jgi:hypothetical protein
MTTIETLQRAGPDAKLRLEIPVAKPDQSYRVVVLVEEEPDADIAMAQWPAGYIEATAGAWQGEFPQQFEGEFEQRESL